MISAKSFRSFSLVVLIILIPVLAAAASSEIPRGSTFSLGGIFKTHSAGQEPPAESKEKLSPIKYLLFLDLGIAYLKEETASRMRTSGSGFTASFGGGASFFKLFDVGVGLGLVFLKDKDPFWNSTTGGEKRSGVNPGYLYIQAGLQVPVPLKNKSGLFPVWIGCHLGAMKVYASREISSCIDCDVEKLSFSGCSYLKPELKFQFAPNVFFGAAYTIFCSKSDFKNMITLSFSGNFSESD